MSNINQIDQQSVLSEYSSNRLNETEEDEDNKNQFLKLMIAQLENQNPLDPKDGTEFLSQLAQFSTVEGIEKLNGNMNSMSETFRSSQALQATALVGRQVKVPSDRGQLGIEGPMRGIVELPSSRSNVNVEIYRDTGDLLRVVPLGTHPGGDLPFSWDGFDDAGNRMPPGEYYIVAKAQGDEVEEQLLTQVEANVDSVTLDGIGGVTLNINGIGNVSLSDIKEIN